MVHSPFENHLFILFLQPDLVIIHGLVVVSEVHAWSPDKAGIDERISGVKIRGLNLGHIQQGMED